MTTISTEHRHVKETILHIQHVQHSQKYPIKPMKTHMKNESVQAFPFS